VPKSRRFSFVCDVSNKPCYIVSFDLLELTHRVFELKHSNGLSAVSGTIHQPINDVMKRL
jgi:hypothetical protein